MRSRPTDDDVRRKLGAIVFIAFALTVVGVLLLGGDGRPEVAGVQFPALTATVGDPGEREWTELLPVGARRREGFPVPMIARGDQVCFGFGRVDFDPPRPTLARCVDADDIPELPAEGLISLVVVRAGADTWHVLATAGELSTVALTADDVGDNRAPIDADDRVHIDAEIVALRIDTATNLTGLEWIIGRTRFFCTPPAGAAGSGWFCPPADG